MNTWLSNGPKGAIIYKQFSFKVPTSLISSASYFNFAVEANFGMLSGD